MWYFWETYVRLQIVKTLNEFTALDLPTEPIDMALRSAVSVLKRLRTLMKVQPEGVSAYIIPTHDAHQSEYVSRADRRLAFVTGFTGSAGTAIISEEQAALWTDGRYHKQAEKQLSSQWTLMKDGQPDTPQIHEWLNKVLPTKAKVGVDPTLMSFRQWKDLERKLAQTGHKLVPVDSNIVDQVWEDRPEVSERPLEMLPLNLTGKSWQEKIVEARKDMRQQGASALVLTALDEIAWLFNLRGSDIEFNPVFFAYAVLTHKSVHLFIEESKMTVALERHLSAASISDLYTSSPTRSNLDSDHMESLNGSMEHSSDGDKEKELHKAALAAAVGAVEAVEIQPYWMFKDFMSMFVQQQSGKIWVDSMSSYAVVNSVPEERRVTELSPIQLRKSVKNSVEIECMKRAHIKDAVALCEFLDWMEKEVPKGNLTELSAADKLESFRKQQEDFVGLSFPTISASGPNAAIIHYRPTEETNKPVNTENIFLLDSGAQYKDGTTDVTRTVHFGTPSEMERECFTRVAKGSIALSAARFPRLTKGNMLDPMARKALWDVGLDYFHGTGHGVGVYLNVHEGPFSISFKNNPNDPGLREGMITSIEPGYYEEDKFGIRIENVALIKEVKTKYMFKRPFLGFETLTLVPIQSKLLAPEMLTEEEIDWINVYHDQVRRVIGNEMETQGKTEALKWLLKNTQPIG